jgi:fructosamine-3-kinase
MNGNWKYIEQRLSQIMGQAIHFTQIHSVGGGCINQAWHVIDQAKRHWFVKSNHINCLPMFEAEFRGLEALAQADCIRVPQPICYGKISHHSYLLMEYIPMSGGNQPHLAGEQLAQLHHIYAKRFGWMMNNTIGTTQQRNKQNLDWIDFWKHQRLRFQLNLALHNGLSRQNYKKGFALSERLSEFFVGRQPKASLLHGDLWGGNLAYDSDNQPVIFDPALYYGDRETDLAMTELFGGFGKSFYEAYSANYPLDAGYKVRKTLYNLYHILNHFNLFGGGYGMQAGKMIQRLLSEIH